MLITQNFYYEIVRVKCANLKLGGKLYCNVFRKELFSISLV